MRVAIIGAGRMGGTIVQMLKKDYGSGWGLEVCEPNQKGRDELAKEVGSGVRFVDRIELLGEAEMILLAVKPAMLEKVAGWLRVTTPQLFQASQASPPTKSSLPPPTTQSGPQTSRPNQPPSPTHPYLFDSARTLPGPNPIRNLFSTFAQSCPPFAPRR